MRLRVCIPTAGTGSRLGLLVNHLNKSLIAVNNKPTISHQIEYFPNDTEFVIPLGYKGDIVKQFLTLAHPNKKFFFVNVKDYTSPNSGLGLSILKCKKFLQQPFIFLSCDTLISGEIPDLKYNWMGYSKRLNPISYRTISIKDKYVECINEKGSRKKNIFPYIGLSGILDFEKFWKSMESGGKYAILQGESYGLKSLISKKIYTKEFEWFDTGNLNDLENTRKKFIKRDSPNILEKENEAIWFVGKQVIKFSADNIFIRNRVKRAKYLKGFIPNLELSKRNMYSYLKVEGDILSEIIDDKLFYKFLDISKSFWAKKKINKTKEKNFYLSCKKFYNHKTKERIKLFYKKFDKLDKSENINGVSMPYLSDLLKNINWESLYSGIAVRFHGDFHFENILYNKKMNKFTFLDWRQDFDGNIEYGDIYYDLAKLLHGIIVNHSIINKNKYEINWKNNNINFKITRKKSLIKCEKIFFQWAIKNNYDVKKIKILTSLIFLNIAPLHHHPYSLLLYALGKEILAKELANK